MLLLLRADVDSPPDWVGDIDVLVGDVSDFTGAFISWVGLNVNSFQRSGKFDISKHDVSNAAVVEVWRNGADTHSNAQVDM